MREKHRKIDFALIYQFSIEASGTQNFIKKVKSSNEHDTFELNSDKGTRIYKEYDIEETNRETEEHNDMTCRAYLTGTEIVVFDSGIGFAVDYFQFNYINESELSIDKIRSYASIDRVQSMCSAFGECEFNAEHSLKPIVFSCFDTKELSHSNSWYRSNDLINILTGKRTKRHHVIEEQPRYFREMYEDFVWDATAQGCCMVLMRENQRNDNDKIVWQATVGLMFDTYIYTLHQVFYYERLRLMCKDVKDYRLKKSIRLLKTYHEQYIDFKANYTVNQINVAYENKVIYDTMNLELDVRTMELTLVNIFEAVQKKTQTAFEKAKNIILAIIEGLTAATLIITILQLVGAESYISWKIILGISLGVGVIVAAVHILSQFPIDFSPVKSFFKRITRKK